MGVPREIELKLELVSPAAASSKRGIATGLGEPDRAPEQLLSVYYDTAKQALARRGLSLRVREVGDRRVQTLKAEGGSGGGLFDRPEWEQARPVGEPGLAVFDDREAADLVGRLDRLAPVFRTEVERTTWTVREGLSLVEVALDCGRIVAGDRDAPIAELELELKEGEPADLFALARRLAASGKLLLAVRSKSERGYALLRPEPAGSVRAEPVSLSRKDSAGDAFRAIARNCLRQFRLNEAILVETRGVEALHQARVAMRRLRSALSLFGKVVADGQVERVKAELRAVSRLLGEARNLDVFLGRLEEAPADADAPTPGEPDGAERLRADRERAYDAVVKKLASRRFRAFTIELAGWIETGPWSHGDDNADARNQEAVDFAAAILDRRWRKIRKQGRDLDRQDPESRHQVRIDAKKLRYASEFFASLFDGKKPSKRRKTFLASCEELQSRLGELNDIETGRLVAERLAAERPAGGSAEDPGLAPAGAGPADAAPVPAAIPESDEPATLAAAVAAHGSLAKAKSFWR